MKGKKFLCRKGCGMMISGQNTHDLWHHSSPALMARMRKTSIANSAKARAAKARNDKLRAKGKLPPLKAPWNKGGVPAPKEFKENVRRVLDTLETVEATPRKPIGRPKGEGKQLSMTPGAIRNRLIRQMAGIPPRSSNGVGQRVLQGFLGASNGTVEQHDDKVLCVICRLTPSQISEVNKGS